MPLTEIVILISVTPAETEEMLALFGGLVPPQFAIVIGMLLKVPGNVIVVVCAEFDVPYSEVAPPNILNPFGKTPETVPTETEFTNCPRLTASFEAAAGATMVWPNVSHRQLAPS
ncbi:MAG: hypothetical protein B7X10_00265 [Burkholderiales bacterium 21-58-4]|nr:MAG: hypothetical protein B7X10_00265 [Burkholderiales bacterium 21-58-4]